MPELKRKLLALLGPSVLVFLIGGLITIISTIWVYQSEEETARVEFESYAAGQVGKLQDLLRADLDLLSASGSLFQNVGIVDRAVFGDFAKPLLERRAGIRSLAWVPMVRYSEREAIEASARNDGFADFIISEREEGGAVRPAGERTSYFPIYYAEPYEGIGSSVGVDLGSDPIKRGAMEMAWSSATIGAAAPKRIYEQSSTQTDVYFFAPVYTAETDMADLLARSQGLVGFSMAVVNAGVFVENIRKETPQLSAERPTSIYIFDIDSNGVVRPIYTPDIASNGNTAAEYLGLIDQYYDQTIPVYGRQWRVIVKPEYSFAPTGGLVPMVAGLGSIFTLMIAGYIYLIRRHSAAIRQALATQSGELREAQRRASGARTDIEAANKAKSVFLATMSHELRTPLTGVLGYIDLLCGKITDPDHRQLIDKLRQAANAQRAIVNDVLDYSRISAGTLEIEHEPFKLQDVLDAAVSTYGTIARDKGVFVGCRMPTSIPSSFVGDPARLQQVVNNLLSNAVKFTHEGSVTVHVNNKFLSAEKCQVEIIVQDTGIGIERDQQVLLFEPFVHTENVTTREFGGTGLGLSICKEITEKMGGTIAVESKVGWGSKFTVCLELAISDADEATYPENSHKHLFGGVPLRVLIVEDYALVRDMLETTLVKAGHVVVAVENGAEAYEAIYSPVGEGFDLILMDMHMPIMDGAEAVKRIRSLSGREGETPIIGMSADVMSEHVKRFMDAGINAFVTKPVDWAELGRVMQSVMHKSHEHDVHHKPFLDPTAAVQPLLLTEIFSQFVETLSDEKSSGLYDATVSFFNDCGKQLEKLSKEPDFKKTKELAHTILGAASTVGAMRVSETAHKLCALDDEPENLNDHIETLSRQLKKSRDEFDKHFSKLKDDDTTVH